jgi:hypothetical protein
MLDGCLEVKTPVRTVRQVAFKHGIPDDKRPVFWRILLGVLTTDKAKWAEDLLNKRELYAKYREEFSVEHLSLFKKYMADNAPSDAASAALSASRKNMTQEEVVRANMLDEDELSADDELFESVRKDVDRTHAELAFFRQSSVRLALIRVLFIYAKLNPGVMYVQGMNEVLAPLFYVLHNDTSDQVEFSWVANSEADTFFCFMNVMAEIMDFFMQGLDKTNMGIRSHLHNLDQMLKRHDEQLWCHLQDQGVMCELYSLRWVSTLLSREFELPDTLLLWDYLFADESRFSFLDEICIAMLQHVREPLLCSGFSPIVKLLQHYPPVDLLTLVGLALKVRLAEPRKLQWEQRKNEFDLALRVSKAKLAANSEAAAAAAKKAANNLKIRATETQHKMQAGMLRLSDSIREKMQVLTLYLCTILTLYPCTILTLCPCTILQQKAGATEMTPLESLGSSSRGSFFRSSSSGSTGSASSPAEGVEGADGSVDRTAPAAALWGAGAGVPAPSESKVGDRFGSFMQKASGNFSKGANRFRSKFKEAAAAAQQAAAAAATPPQPQTMPPPAPTVTSSSPVTVPPIWGARQEGGSLFAPSAGNEDGEDAAELQDTSQSVGGGLSTPQAVQVATTPELRPSPSTGTHESAQQEKSIDAKEHMRKGAPEEEAKKEAPKEEEAKKEAEEEAKKEAEEEKAKKEAEEEKAMEVEEEKAKKKAEEEKAMEVEEEKAKKEAEEEKAKKEAEEEKAKKEAEEEEEKKKAEEEKAKKKEAEEEKAKKEAEEEEEKKKAEEEKAKKEAEEEKAKKEAEEEEKKKAEEEKAKEAEEEKAKEAEEEKAKKEAEEEEKEVEEEKANQEATEKQAKEAAVSSLPQPPPSVLQTTIPDPSKEKLTHLFAADPRFGRYTNELAVFFSVLATKANAPVQLLHSGDGVGLLLRLPLTVTGGGGLLLPTKHTGKISKIGTPKETDSFLPFDLQLNCTGGGGAAAAMEPFLEFLVTGDGSSSSATRTAASCSMQ